MSTTSKDISGVARVVRATGYSLQGLAAAYRGERAFRLETWLAALLLPLSFWVGRSWVEVALLAGTVVLVLVAELLNSAIEAAIDRVSFELHALSKRAKDLASAAVFLSVLLCGCTWTAALWARIPAAGA